MSNSQGSHFEVIAERGRSAPIYFKRTTKNQGKLVMIGNQETYQFYISYDYFSLETGIVLFKVVLEPFEQYKVKPL